ncbi:MAG: sigma factor-like helix-turn-helix DNA-binding protein [Candidatus Pacebacteria bacterium]|jgi:DNA-directed RNA polymerase delta subunit|nr:sigma factor-like helix-turn-helix DNA-binding protein [Candidatus Paceibacterota bacterium]|tara:strand:+ start:3481 stop:4512 length:1032 start_codon:yes stop_codon:yes gene_type:complete
MSAIIAFKPKQVTKRLLIVLPPRAREVVTNRYGLGKNIGKMTLEAIGSQYGITRERVRQIENAALGSIRKSDAFSSEKNTFNELASAIDSLGGIVSEDELLELISKDKNTQNHALLLLVLGDEFSKRKDDDEFKSHWYVDEELEDAVHRALKNVYENLSLEDLIPEPELINSFLDEVKDLNKKYKDEEIARRWLTISKMLGKNPLGEWGVADSSNVRVKGMRDYAYLAIKKNGSPMHFTEVAKAISNFFGIKAHTATCHNELIKDPRFVLVGRGLYALSEWGYTSGVVKDVIAEILKKHGSLTKEEIIDKVRKERYIKDNTIIVNLQNRDHFKINKDEKYLIV